MTNSDPSKQPGSIGEGRHVEAYVDEAGEKGFLRNFDPSTDDKIAVLAAIAVPGDERERFRAPLAIPFERFKAARPAGNDSLHITDAFASGNEDWAAVAREVRVEIFACIKKLTIPIIYDARRLRVARVSFARLTKLVNQAHAERRSDIKVSHRPSAERIEETCMIGLALKLDALAVDRGLGVVDLLTDQMDRPIARLFKEMIGRTRNISSPKEKIVPGWNPKVEKEVSGSIRIKVTDAHGQPIDWLDAKHLGDLVVLGKDDPLLFAADVVVNALHHHLRGLPRDAWLNQPSSINGWDLAERVYGVREDAFEDII
jgi:hypothetical protein